MPEPTDFGPTSSDEALIDQVHQGCPGAFNQLVLRYQALAYNVAYRILGESGAAADATQDSFLKAYRRLDQFRARGTSFRAWLLRIVINTCYDAFRSQRRHRAHVVRIDEDNDEYEWNGGLRDPRANIEEYVLRQELGERLRAAINGLPPDQRTILVLSDVEGFSQREIADTIGVPVGTVKSRLFRARARARQVILTERHGLAHAQRTPAPRSSTVSLAESRAMLAY